MEVHGRVRSEPVGVWSTGHSAWAPCEVRAGGGLEYRAPSLGPRSELGGALRGRGTCALTADSPCCTQKSTRHCRAVLLQLKALK